MLNDAVVSGDILGDQWQGAEINAEHPEGVNALMYGAAGAHLGVVQVQHFFLWITVAINSSVDLSCTIVRLVSELLAHCRTRCVDRYDLTGHSNSGHDSLCLERLKGLVC